MSFTARFDQGDEFQVATTKGWNDLADWSRQLPVEDYSEIAHLVDYGWNYVTDSLVFELRQAVKSRAPEDTGIADTVAGLIVLLEEHADAEVIIVGQGFEEEQEPESAPTSHPTVA